MEGFLPLELGTNTVVINARDAAGNMTSNVFTIIASTRFRAAITNPVFGAFAGATSNFVSGYVSAKFDGGLPTETNVTSVSINGVTAVLVTNVDANGNMRFTSTQKIPLGVPITGQISGPGIPLDPSPTIPPAMSQEYEVTQKYKWKEDPPLIPSFTGSSCDFSGPCTSLLRKRQSRIATVATNQPPRVDVQNINETWNAQLCSFDANPDGLAWTQTSSNTQFSTAFAPENRSLAVGVSSYRQSDRASIG